MLRTAIIGTGGIAYCHGEALKKLGVEIAGAFDIVPENAARFAREYDARTVKKIEDVLDDVDMVHICTPPSKRLEYAEKAMAAGKHVVMEKPLATSLDDARRIVALAERNRVRLLVGFNHRFRDGFRKLRKAVDSGVLGDTVGVFINRYGFFGASAGLKAGSWRTNPDLACGMTIESLSHDIDMLLQLAPGGIASVQARTAATVRGLPGFDTDAHVLFTFGGGAAGALSASWSSRLKWSSRGVVGTKGTASLNGTDIFDFTEFRLKTDDMPEESLDRLGDVYRFVGCRSYTLENKHFIDCIENGAPSEVTGEHALRVLELSFAILESARTGGTVKTTQWTAYAGKERS